MENPQVQAPSIEIVQTARPCVRCSYDLRGLPVVGTCPECGEAVATSLRGQLIQYASDEYVKTLRSGFSLVLNSILLQIVISVMTVAATFIAASMGSGVNLSGKYITFAAVLLGLPVSVLSLLGYWRITEPDPGFVGIEKPDSARGLLRNVVMVQAACAVANVVTTVMRDSGSGASGVAAIVTLVLGVVSFIAFCVQFFAMMKYMGWLAKRVPDAFLFEHARKYQWLLPVLQTVGLLLVGLGPLIALILYWNLLDRMRKHLKSIQTTGIPAVLKGMMETSTTPPIPAPPPPTA